jgi:hypothetical protein
VIPVSSVVCSPILHPVASRSTIFGRLAIGSGSFAKACRMRSTRIAREPGGQLVRGHEDARSVESCGGASSDIGGLCGSPRFRKAICDFII